MAPVFISVALTLECVARKRDNYKEEEKREGIGKRGRERDASYLVFEERERWRKEREDRI